MKLKEKARIQGKKKVILRSKLGGGVDDQMIFSALTKACEGIKVSYNTIKIMSFPILHDGYRFDFKIVNDDQV
jgi:hypothetical protein